MQQSSGSGEQIRAPGILLNDAAPPTEIPNGYVGPVWLPATGRMVWWTGRVAIGLRHDPRPAGVAHGESAYWLQSLMLN